MLSAGTGRRPAWMIALFAAAMTIASWTAPQGAWAQEGDAEAPAPAAIPADAQDAPAPADGLDEDAADADAAAPQAKRNQVDDSRMIMMLALVAAVFIIPVVAGHYLAQALRMPDHATRISVVLFAALAGTVATWSGWPPKLGIDLSGGSILIYEVEQENFDEMDKLVQAVSKRVNPAGIKEVTVRPYGEREIEIIIPEADPDELERMQTIVSQTGQLEFRIVADRRFKEDVPIIELAEEARYQNRREITDENEDADDAAESSASGESEKMLLAKWVPVAPKEALDFELNRFYATRRNKRDEVEVLVLADRFNVTGEYLTNASPGVDQFGKPCVNFAFNSKGANRFGKMTSENLPNPAQPDLHRALAIILDRQLYSAPTIRSRIDDRGEITGSFTPQQVEDLATVLTAGSLPTTLRKEPTSSLTTGALLGEDTIRKGVRSMLVSTVAVVVFMLVYYQFAGIVANLALLLNVLLIVAFMILFNAAFTLSGLAGLALTVGMAVDANVLIYERIREETARGATLRMAIRNGFDRATTTIVDANVTTLISAIVLYAIGTDQVKGFAVTLILGIVMNLFTAITFTRLIFEIAERQRWISRLRMLKVLENPNFDFVGKRKLAVAFSLLLITVGLVGVVQRGKGLLDIDFTGGVSVETLFDKDQDIADVRAKVAELPDVTVQEVSISDEPPRRRFLIITSKSDIDEANPPQEGPKSNVAWVEAELKQTFGAELAYNRMTSGEIEPIAAAKGAAAGENAEKQDSGKEEAEPKENAASPEKKPAEEKKAAEKDGEQGETDTKKADEAKDDETKDDQAGDDSETQADGDEGEAKQGDGAALSPRGEWLLALADDENPAAKAAPASDASARPPAEAEKPADDHPSATAPAEKAPGDEGADASEPADQGAAASPGPAFDDPYAGGSQVELSFSQGISHDALSSKIQQALSEESVGEDTPFQVDNPDYEEGSKRGFDKWTLKIAAAPDVTQKLLDGVGKSLEAEPYFPASNKVGASVAGNTQQQAAAALLASLVMIIVYVWIRFQQVSFGLSSVLALVHDVLVALGALALSFWLARLPFASALLIEPFKINLPIIAAFLTIIGYSINDTIVIFDRIREVRGKSHEMPPELVNLCINQTLSRTLLTSLTVFIVVLILYMFGGQGIHGFAFTLVVGTISGTYSTVYVATPILLWMNKSTPAVKTGSPNASREASPGYGSTARQGN